MSLQSYIAESKKVSLGNGIELAFKPKNMPIAYYLMHKEVPLATCTFDLTGKSNLSLPSSYDKLRLPNELFEWWNVQSFDEGKGYGTAVTLAGLEDLKKRYPKQLVFIEDRSVNGWTSNFANQVLGANYIGPNQNGANCFVHKLQ